jgi:hypothetical protein
MSEAPKGLLQALDEIDALNTGLSFTTDQIDGLPRQLLNAQVRGEAFGGC